MTPLSKMQSEGGRELILAKHIFLGLAGLAAGGAVAAGTFAFIIMLGVVPRMIGKSKTASSIMGYENAIIIGGILGNLVSVFLTMQIPLGHAFLVLYGTSAGIFVGCNAVALAEVLQSFPIIFRRIKIKQGLSYAIIAFAIGKSLGCLWFFFERMAAL